MDVELARSLKRGEFIIGDYTSRQLRSKISTRPLIEKPRRKKDRRTLPFQDGDIVFDQQSYHNTTLNLECFFIAETEEERDELRELITFAFDSAGYMEFVPYFDKTKIYLVDVIEAPDFQGNFVHKHKEPYSVTFSVKPFKYLLDNQEIEFQGQTTITNPKLYASKPIIEIEGSGTADLNVSGTGLFRVNNIQDKVIIDTRIPSLYQVRNGVVINEEYKVSRNHQYPVLEPGNNTLTLSSGFTAKINPRWWTL